jgi:K+-transporting ATPase KdpF subunit
MPGSAKRCAERIPANLQPLPPMENLIISLIAVLLLLYLVAAVLRPEKF